MTASKNTKLLELTNNLRINGQLVEDCANGLLTDINANKWFYNPFIDGFQFEIDLGDCNMTAKMITFEGKKYLKFGLELDFHAAPVPGADIFFGEVGNYKLGCKPTQIDNLYQPANLLVHWST